MTPVMPVASGSARYAVGYNPPAAAFVPATTVVTATKTDSFPDPDGDNKAEPGQTITYDVNVSNTGASDATGVNFNDTIDPNTTLVPGSLRVSPLAFADSYNATRNVALSISAPGVLTNDTGTPAPTAQPIASGPTSQGGSVTLNADGSFNYTPPSGFQGADTFTYTATNGLSPNDSATVTINVDEGPSVTTTSPVGGANNVAQNTNITVNFTEPVNATTASFSIQCPVGSPQTFTLSASPAASFTLDPTADLPAGTTCTVTVFANQITDADNFDPPDQMAADYTFSFGVKPLAVDDMHSVTGNVRIDSSISGYSVLANDQGPGAVISAFDATSVHGGNVTMNTGTGTFTYDPPRGFTGTDSFNYTLSNGGGSDTGTVVLTVSDMIWFINNEAGACSSACDGRLTHPFTTLAAFEAINGNGTTVGGAVIDPEAGDNIFIYTGGSNYTAPLTLENSQRLIGQGAAGALIGVVSLTGITPAPDSDALPSTGGTAPTITSPGFGVTLAQNDRLHGLAFSNTTNTAVNGAANVGTFTMSEISVNNTTSAAGIVFTGGGTISSTGVNTITTAGGTALNVTSTDIDSTNLTFQSISAGTAVGTAGVGINLKNTGTGASNGGLIVTGNSAGQCGGQVVINNSGAGTESVTAADSADCTGGQIRNKTGADGSTTAGIGIYLENTRSVSLTRMWLHDFQNFAVRGFRVSGVTLSSVLVNGTNGTSPTFDNYGEGGVYFGDDASATTNGLTGSASVTNSSFSGGRARNFSVVNTAGTLDRLTITGSNFGLTQNFFDSDDSLSIESRDADPGTPVVKVTVTSSRFTGAAGDLAQFLNQSGTGTMDVVFQNNNLSDNHAQNIVGGGGLSLDTNAAMTLNVSDNHLRDADGSAVTLQKANLGTSLNGTLNHNRIGVSGVADSGSKSGNGLFFSFAGGGSVTLAVTNNDIRQYAGSAGIYDDNTGGNYGVNLSVKNNVLAEPGSSVFAGLVLTAGAPSSSDDIDVCADITGNDFSTADPNDSIDVLVAVSTAASSMRLPGYVGATTSDVQTFIQNNNLNSATTAVLAYTDPPATDANFIGGAACAQPIAQLNNDSFSTSGNVVEVAASTTTSPAREWSDMKASSASSAVNNRTDSSVFVNASYEPPVKRAKTKGANKQAKAASRAATLAQPFSGETVNASIGTLPAGKTVHITFQVTVDNSFTGSQVSNQATISGDNFALVQTDDPAAGGSADATVTPILTPPNVAVKDASVAEPASGSAPAAFAVTLSHAYTHTVTVNYTTASGGANPATAGSDYTSTSGTLTFNPGETVQTISVSVLADADASETNETFFVNLSGATGGATITDSQGVGTITPESTPGTVIISELRTSGPAGADDEFVELYNNTDSAITVAASDASGGWALVKSGNDCNATPVVVAVIPNGTVIPARGNYLVVGTTYSLGAYAAGDQTLVFGIEGDSNVALFNTADLSNISTVTRLDAVGFGANSGGNCDLLREGTTLQPAAGSTSEYSFVRKVDKGATADTNDNASDFIVVSTTGGAVGSNAAPTLGSPGPENSTGARGPVPCNVPDTARFGRSRLDSTVALGSSPNTVRDATSDPVNNSTFGTIDFRRRFTNNTGGAVTRLRFRITNTTNPSTPGAADLRARSSATAVVGGVNDATTCGGSTPCNVTVAGTTLEQPPVQTSGGGVNSTLGVGTITLATPLVSGASVNLHLLFGVQQHGNYHVSIVIETETAGSIGQDEWELRGNTQTGGDTEGGCNTPPVANAGADQIIECGGGLTSVTLDGTASTDADGDTLTYEWREGATVLGTTATLNTSLPFGPHTITLKVTDPSGDFSEDTVNINIVDTTDPMITAPSNVSVNTGPGASSCGAFVSDATLGSATASDGCSASVTITRTGVPAGNNFPVGTTIVTYTANDGHGHTKSAQQVVTVTDNTPPVITTPANIVVNAPPNSCSVNVNPGTATATDNCPGVTVSGARSDSQPLNAPYPVGTTTITWTANDTHGNSASGTQTVKVNDVTPPTIVLTTNAISLGSPNHSYQTLSIANLVASVSDGCDPSVDINDVVISQATSDEAEDAPGGGDGNTSIDIVIAPDCKSLQLRAERQGSGDGRVYKITLKVKDSSGNVATAVRTVIVQQGGSGVDSGVQYTVNGCTP
jgi:uncharacterized repeat protein (TIGR01451 family)